MKIVKGSGLGKLHATMQSGSHVIVSGLDKTLGGDDEAPDPHVILEASLAACTILTLQLYADRKKWDLKTIDVAIRIDSEGKDGTHITRDISFGADLDAEKIERLMEIANKCPIHKLLTGHVVIETLVKR